MLDLNYLLLFIAIASPLVLLWRLLRLRRERPGGWSAAAVIVLVVSGISYLLAPSIAGYLGGAVWAFLLLAPSLAERRIARLLIEKHYRAARQFAVVRRVLHPWHSSAKPLRLLRALQCASAGNLPSALKLLKADAADDPAAIAFGYALGEDWRGLVQWCRRDLTITQNPAVRALYLRALGEGGALEDLAWSFAARSQTLEPRLTISPQFAQELLYLLAFCGRTDGVVSLMRGPLAGFPRAHRQFWVATAELAEGKTDSAVKRLTTARGETDDAILERAAERRLRQARDFPVARVAPATGKLLGRLASEAAAESTLLARSSRPIAVWVFIALNIAMFCAELALGGATNDRVLRQLGALETDVVVAGHQYWRLITSLFLHYGFLHIAVNLYALYLLGPALERMIGSVRFAAGYLLCGLGSGAGVVLLYALGLTRSTELVGASGCVMGVIGISAGRILRHRQSPLAGRRLREILAIVIFQTLFDLVVPQVSLGAHLCGFISGLLVGLVLANRRSAR